MGMRWIVILALAMSAGAQDYRARVQGMITDTSRAVVPGANVVLRNDNTGVQVSRQSSESGQYLFDFVDPGTYTLLVEHQGFNRFMQENILVQVRGDVDRKSVV